MRRRRVPEQMDAPTLPREEHEQALRGLCRINALSRSGQHLVRAIESLTPSATHGTVRIVDLACGGGENALFLARHARRRRLPWRVTGLDRSITAIEASRRRARHAGVHADFLECDVLRDVLPSCFDIAVCSLFLHHLDRPDAVRLVQRMHQAASLAIIVNDLVRSRPGWLAAWIGTRVLSRSPIVHFDGPQSVRAAWTRAEMRSIASDAGIKRTHMKVRRTWPFRMTLTAIGGASS